VPDPTPPTDPAEPTGEPTKEPTPAPEPTPQSADKVEISKADYDALQSQIAAFRRQQKKAEEAAKAAEQKRLEEEGKHKELAEAEKARADKAEADLKTFKRDQRIERLATKKGFHDAKDAIANLPGDLDRDDEAAVEAALEQVAKTKPYLLDKGTPTRTGGPAGGAQPPANLDEQIREAEVKGDFKLAGALKARKLATLTSKE
jgi:hypothetical protein